MAKADKVTVAEVKAAAEAAGEKATNVRSMSQAERQAAINSYSAPAPTPSGGTVPASQSAATNPYIGQTVSQVAASQPTTPVGGLTQVSSPGTPRFMDAPADLPAALADYAIMGQFQNRAGKDFFVDQAGDVYKVNAKGVVKPVSRFDFGDQMTGAEMRQAYGIEGDVIMPPADLGYAGYWSDYNVERPSGKIAKYPTSTFAFYNPITGEVEPPIEEEEEGTLTDSGGGGAPPTAPSYPNLDQWTQSINYGTGGRQNLNLAPPGSDDYTLPSGNQIFNIDWRSDPFSGKNWGATTLAQTGLDVNQLYSAFMDATRSGNFSMSSLARQMGLPPGAIHELYKQVTQYATQTGKPLPVFPEFSAATAPYYTYGFGPQRQQVGFEIPGQAAVADDPATTGVDESKAAVPSQWRVNPLGYWMGQLEEMRGAPDVASPQAAPTLTPQYGSMYGANSYAEGGHVQHYRQGGLTGIEQDPAIKRYLKGGSGGQDDQIPAMLSDGEYVFDADSVAALGDGNNEAGARKLDKMRQNIRAHKRSAPATKIPPKAKKPEQYLKGK